MRHSPAIDSTTSILFRSCSGKKVLISANTGITTHVKVIKGLRAVFMLSDCLTCCAVKAKFHYAIWFEA